MAPRADKGDKGDKLLIPAAEEMLLQTLRLHIQKRHKPRLGFWSYTSQAQDHKHRQITCSGRFLATD